MPDKKKLLMIGLLFCLLLVIVIFVVSLFNGITQTRQISSFEQCEQAGFAINGETPRQCITPDGKVFIEENITQSPIGGQLGIKGEIACLPKKGNGPQTMECAIGLLGQDGRYYALENLGDVDPEMKFSQGGKKVDIYGNLTIKEITAPDGNNYDIAGSIRIDNITEDIN